MSDRRATRRGCWDDKDDENKDNDNNDNNINDDGRVNLKFRSAARSKTEKLQTHHSKDKKR